MLATTFSRNSDPADSSVNGHFRSFRAVYSRYTLREGARAEDVRDILGHANIDVTQNVYGRNCWEEREDAATRAVEAMTHAAQNTEKEENQAVSAPGPLAPQVA
jgi:integrase